MSAETDLQALLEAHTGLSALVSDRIAENAVPQGEARPYVVYSSKRTPEFGLDNTVLATNTQFRIECWADDAADAHAVADQVEVALAADGTVCTSRITGQDPELGLDAVILTADWWS